MFIIRMSVFLRGVSTRSRNSSKSIQGKLVCWIPFLFNLIFIILRFPSLSFVETQDMRAKSIDFQRLEVMIYNVLRVCVRNLKQRLEFELTPRILIAILITTKLDAHPFCLVYHKYGHLSRSQVTTVLAARDNNS